MPWMTAAAAESGASSAGSATTLAEWVASRAPMMPPSASPAPAVASQFGAASIASSEPSGDATWVVWPLSKHDVVEVRRGPLSPARRVAAMAFGSAPSSRPSSRACGVSTSDPCALPCRSRPPPSMIVGSGCVSAVSSSRRGELVAPVGLLPDPSSQAWTRRRP
jgi:hypothetical protein